MYQKLLGSAAILLVLHNALLLALGTLSTIEMSQNLSSHNFAFLLIWIGTDGLDIVGILLLGVGLHVFSQTVPQGVRYAKRSSGLFLLWVPLTVIWRPFGRAAFGSQRPLGPHSWVYVFFLAAIILAAAVYNLNQMMGRIRGQRNILEGDIASRILYDRYQKQEVIMDQAGTLYITYAWLNVLGVFLVTLINSLVFIWGWNWEWGPFLGLFLILLGGFIKGGVVPILGILVFAHLYGMRKCM